MDMPGGGRYVSVSEEAPSAAGTSRLFGGRAVRTDYTAFRGCVRALKHQASWNPGSGRQAGSLAKRALAVRGVSPTGSSIECGLRILTGHCRRDPRTRGTATPVELLSCTCFGAEEACGRARSHDHGHRHRLEAEFRARNRWPASARTGCTHRVHACGSWDAIGIAAGIGPP